MEREQTNREKGFRVIQQKSGSEGRINIVDNRANSVRSLMRGGKVSQRVIQRVNEANGKFIFSPRLVINSSYRIPYTGGTIHFTDFGNSGEEILSDGFNGCYMMVFRFNMDPMRERDVNALFQAGSIVLPRAVLGSTFVAHVANDEVGAIFDAVERGLIFVDLIFRPYNGATTKGHPFERKHKDNLWSDKQARIELFTAGAKIVENGVEGHVYGQEKVPKDKKSKYLDNPAGFDWEIEEKVKYPVGVETDLRTQATMVYICARVFIDALLDGDVGRMNLALSRLREARARNPRVLEIARDEVLNISKDGVPSWKINGRDIFDFFTAILRGEEDEFIAYLRRRLKLPPLPQEDQAEEEHSDGEHTSDEAKTEKKGTDLDDDDDDDD